MAFTFSHAVLAPYLYRLTGQHLPLMPLVIGTMLPDITRVVFPIPMAHHFSGMFSINLLSGGILCLLWYWLYRPVLYHHFEWMSPHPISRTQYIKFSALVMVALLLGNFSHLFWDSFTHLDDRTWFAHQFLGQTISIFNITLYWHQFLQYATSILVLPWLYWGFKHVFNLMPKREIHIALHQKKFIQLHVLIAIMIATIIGFIQFILLMIADQFPIYWCLVQGFKYFCVVLFIYITVFCLCRYKVLKA